MLSGCFRVGKKCWKLIQCQISLRYSSDLCLVLETIKHLILRYVFFDTYYEWHITATFDDIITVGWV